MMHSLFPVGFFFLVVAVLAWVTIRSKEGWPLSCYPMFSHPMTLSDVVVFRLALETLDGEVLWWNPIFPRDQRRVGKVLLRDYLSESQQDPVFLHRQSQQHLAEVARLIVSVEGDIGRYCAFRVIKRTVQVAADRQIQVEDNLIHRIPLERIFPSETDDEF